MAPPDAQVRIDALTLTLEERRIIGCWYGSCRPPVDFPLLIDLYQAGRLRLDPLISATCRLDEINDAFARIEHGSGARTLIVYDEEQAS